MSEETEQKPIAEPEPQQSETEPATETAPAPETAQETAPAQKKSRFGLYLFILILLGSGGAWGFWQYSPLIPQLKEQWLNSNAFNFPFMQQEPTRSAMVEEEQLDEQPASEPVEEEPVQQNNPNETTDSYVFESGQEIKIEHELNAIAEVQGSNFEELQMVMQSSMQQMQKQIAQLQNNINAMHDQQNTQAQQYVKAQLFAALQKACSPLSNTDDIKAAWKSIGFMPLLSEDQRALAEQAYSDLQNMLSKKQQISEEISTWIATLSEKIDPDEAEEAVGLMDDVSLAPTDSFASGLAWLKKQFVITKVSTISPMRIGSDPYADIKRLIKQLDDLQELLDSGDIELPEDLDNLFYQLAQHGIETSLSPQDLLSLYEINQSWKVQAQDWMEQL